MFDPRPKEEIKKLQHESRQQGASPREITGLRVDFVIVKRYCELLCSFTFFHIFHK